MKKLSAILVLFLTLLIGAEVEAAEVIHSVDDTVAVMNKAIAAHSDKVEFEAYFDVTQDKFGTFFKEVLVKKFNEQFTDHGNLIKNIGVSYLCMSGKCDGYFSFEYYASQQDYFSYKQHINQLAAQNQHLSYDEKIAFVNNYLIQHTEYDHTLKSLPSPYSPVAIYREGLGVCQAYAIFAHDLLKALGVESYLLDGVANGDLHLWNVLKDSSGNIVHLDTTWNDTSRTNNYYLISTAQISKTHSFSQNSLDIITNRLNTPIPNPNEEELKPDYTQHAMYLYAKEFLVSKQNIQHLTDLGVLTNDNAFEIKFNQNVLGTQDFKTKVFITDNKGAVVDVLPVIDGRYLRIYKEDSKRFESGEVYNLVILNGIESAQSSSVYLKDSLYVTFTVQ